MSERALAHIEKIEWVKPIEGADNIELIGVLGWVCIAKKEEFKEGDLAVYIEIDSRVPKEDERFAFLAS
ncbi:MAG: 2'-5' RNA ligase, partial [Lachnospiraceae bacterium]|nr:2'-5' RNA ligase [Lachnospiraceae bacterium]